MSYSYQPAAGGDAKQPRYTFDYTMESEKEVNQMQKSDVKLKIHIRFFKLVVRVMTLALSIFAIYTQAHVLIRFRNTRGIVREAQTGERNPWARNTVLWPTILLLTTACLSTVVSLLTVISYFKGIARANKHANVIGTPTSVVEICAHLAVWIATTIGYRIGRTTSDLWGWTCSPGANRIQDIFPEVNFRFFCRMQGGSWIASIAQSVLMLISLLVWILAWRRHRQQKKLVTRRSMMIPEGHYSQQQQPA